MTLLNKNYLMLLGCFMTVSVFAENSITNSLSNVESEQGPYKMDLPEFQEEPTKDFFKLPVIPKAKPLKPSGSQFAFILRGIEFSGHSVFTQSDLDRAIEPWLNQLVDVNDLEEIRLKITQLYIQKGYINSGALIPKQTIKHGVVRINIIEGRLSTINIKGAERLKDAYIRERLWNETDQLLNSYQLQERFQRLLANPMIERLNGQLKPGTQLGESILELDVKRAKPYRWKIGFNNHHSSSSGAEQGYITGSIDNLSGYGDQLFLNLNKSKGAWNFDSRFSLPVTANDTQWVLFLGQSNSEIIEQSLKKAQIESDYQYIESGLSIPLKNTFNEQFKIDVHLALRRSQTFFLGNGRPFNLGVEDDGTSRTSVLRFIQEYSLRQPNEVWIARSTFNLGLKIFNATINHHLPDGDFFNWVGQTQYARRFEETKSQMILRANIQLSSDELLPLERFSVGGANSVRGYRENTYVRDNGFYASAEYRYPLLGDPFEEKQKSLQWAVFFDTGIGWNKHEWDNDDLLSSGGIGLRWQHKTLNMNIYLAKSFKHIDYSSDHNLQDDGIHFSMEYRLP